MKKTGWIALAALLIVMTGAGPLFAAKAGTVLAVRRNAYLERQGNRNRAEVRMPILQEDAVATEEASRAKLYFADDSILNLGELSRVEVEEYLRRPGTERTKSIYKLLDGTLKVVVGNSDLEIHTPTAVAAARGTKFYVTIRDCREEGGAKKKEGCKESCLFVSEGKVELHNIKKNIKGTVTVGKGEASCVPLDGPPTDITPYAATDAEALAQSTAVFEEFPEEKIEERITENPEEILNDTEAGTLPEVEQEPQEGLTPVTVIIQYP